MTDKEREIEEAYKELASANTISEPDNKVDYWADYEEAEYQQYLAEQDKLDAEQEEIDRAREIELAKKRPNPAPDQYIITQRKPIYWDVSGDDSSLNPAFW